MNKPETNGRFCSEHCPYIGPMFRFKHYEKRPCSAYGEKVRNLVDDSSFNRLPACIAEHGLDGSQWRKEPPSEYGLYFVLSGDGKGVACFDNESPDDIPIIDLDCGEPFSCVLRDIDWWSKRIEFPELSEDSNGQ